MHDQKEFLVMQGKGNFLAPIGFLPHLPLIWKVAAPNVRFLLGLQKAEAKKSPLNELSSILGQYFLIGYSSPGIQAKVFHSTL